MASLPSPRGSVTFTPDGIDALEDAMEALLHEQKIKTRWSEENLWALIATMTVAASEAANVSEFIERALSRVMSARQAVTIVLLANVRWDSEPLAIGDAVVGKADRDFFELVNRRAGERCTVGSEAAEAWLRDRVLARPAVDGLSPVAVATWSHRQDDGAFRAAQRAAGELVDLCLLMTRELSSYRASSVEVNRPGVRGLVLDRSAVTEFLPGSSRMELVAQPLTVTDLHPSSQTTHWYSADPLPLDAALLSSDTLNAVETAMKPWVIGPRIRTSARWFGEAFFTSEADDSSLALGVAMDALLSGRSAVPGGAMADRFALLERDPVKRLDRRAQYLDLYGVRSSVAHGGRSSRLSDQTFTQSYQQAVHWAARRMLELGSAFAPDTPNAVDTVFDQLRLGAAIWPSEQSPLGQVDPVLAPKADESITLGPCGSEL
ncbi:hypothetical protein [Modestobacter versicolor]|uniref:Apea-like HEPN domain-containing protein n=2 Tax=Modestobacter versicolor TaxID=429133 RepID=A0A839Y573_9ACTN|nr:hypothetical protein [Modestobacter versicolor]MBB3677577.1 hypothetical protein [Modestobacter versicolor]